MRFDEWMRARMETLGLAQSDVRRAMEERGGRVNRSSVSQWATGEFVPDAANAREIIAVLGDSSEGWKAWGRSRGIPSEYTSAVAVEA